MRLGTGLGRVNAARRRAQCPSRQDRLHGNLDVGKAKKSKRIVLPAGERSRDVTVLTAASPERMTHPDWPDLTIDRAAIWR